MISSSQLGALGVAALLGISTADAQPAVTNPCNDSERPMTSAGAPCPRMEPISDPVAPPPPPNFRVGGDLGTGWHFGSSTFQKPLLVMGVSADWRLVPALAAGIRVGYLGAAGNAVDLDGDGRRETNTTNLHALEPSFRIRFRLGDAVRRLELESAFTHRFVLGGDIPNHFTFGLGAMFYLASFGIGVRYARALQDTVINDAVYITTERNSPMDVDPRGSFGASSAPEYPRVGLGLHAIVTGWGFAEHLGPMLPGAAIELPVSFGGPLAPVARYDFLWFPGVDASAFVAQTVLGGLEYLQIAELPIGCGVLLGYSMVGGPSPRTVDGGPVVDGGAWYWLDRLGLHLGLNGRFGLTEQNRDLRALYVSIGARQIF